MEHNVTESREGWSCSCGANGDFESVSEYVRFRRICPLSWIVIGYKPFGGYGVISDLFQVGERGRTTKEIQDSIAEYAGDHPEIIYMVVLETEYRKIFQAICADWGIA